MRILFFGDYSNLHACLAGELQARGHEVTVVSDGGRYMHTYNDVLLDRGRGRFGTLKYIVKLGALLPKLRGYDVVQFINPHFVTLLPERIKYIFNYLKRHNGSLFLTLAGNDYYFVKACMDEKIFKFSEFCIGNVTTEFEKRTHQAKNWTAPGMKEFCKYIYDRIDGAMSVLPEYDMAARPYLGDRLAFTNIPVDISKLSPKPLDTSGKVNLFIGMRRGMELQKGTGLLHEMCRQLENEMPDKCTVTQVGNLPLNQYLCKMQESHIVLDQLHSYSPGTNAFQAMALGKVAATGAQPEFYEYLDEPDNGGIIPLSPLMDMDDWKEKFRQLILSPDCLQSMADEGRRIVASHNDVGVVTSKFERHWKFVQK